MIEIKGKKYRNLQEQVQKNMEDIEELKNAGQAEYSAGTGIDIEDGVISVDEDVAMKTDLDYDNLSNKPDLTEYAKLDDDTQNITAASMTVTPGSGYIHTTYGPSSISMSIPRTPGYTLNIPTKDGTLATTDDVNEYTAGSGISISSNTIAVDNTIARVADIPTLSGLVMYNYKITISGLDHGTSTARSAVYIVSLPYQWDYSSLTKYDIIRLVPVWSIVADTDVTSTRKIMGVFHWQTGTIAQIDWTDGTFTFMDFTGGFNATVEAAAPAHW